VVAASMDMAGVDAALGLPKVPDFWLPSSTRAPATGPSTLTVVVPALNEEARTVGECLESLLAQEYISLSIVAVNDRSTDGTGAMMDGWRSYPDRVTVMHIDRTSAGWLGKTHAMAKAAT
jgi:cellulose synthase/poly-beta-1,6-N-acetylglucosamine synthase-like glycosyltransferase